MHDPLPATTVAATATTSARPTAAATATTAAATTATTAATTTAAAEAATTAEAAATATRCALLRFIDRQRPPVQHRSVHFAHGDLSHGLVSKRDETKTP